MLQRLDHASKIYKVKEAGWGLWLPNPEIWGSETGGNRINCFGLSHLVLLLPKILRSILLHSQSFHIKLPKLYFQFFFLLYYLVCSSWSFTQKLLIHGSVYQKPPKNTFQDGCDSGYSQSESLVFSCRAVCPAGLFFSLICLFKRERKKKPKTHGALL